MRCLMTLVTALMVGACWADGISGDTYTRTKVNGSWGTLCLPRTITKIEGATVWIPYYCAKSETSWVSPLYILQIPNDTTISAETPVMFCYTSAQIVVTMSDSEGEKPLNSTHMVGNLDAADKTVPDGDSNFVLAWTWKKPSDHTQGGADEIREVTTGGEVTIPQYRAYFDFTDLPEASSSARANVLGWQLDGGIIDEPTGIMTIDGQLKPTTPAYDINGRHVGESAHGGIIIVDGKKVVRLNK